MEGRQVEILDDLPFSTVLRKWNLLNDTIQWSPLCLNLFGYEQGQLSQHGSSTWRQLIHEDDKERVSQSLSRSFASDARFWCEEYRITAADGTLVTVIDQITISRNSLGHATSVIGSMFNPVQRSQLESINNTPRYRMLNTLKQAFSTDATILLNTILSNTTSGLFCMDSKGHPTYMNEAAEKITGYKLSEICERPLHYAIHYLKPDGSPYPMQECPIDNAQAKLTAAQNQTEIFVDKAGRLFPVVWSVRPLEDRGRTIGAVIEFRDVTEEQAAQKERLNAMVELRHAETRAKEEGSHKRALAQFIDYLSHELRNPLHGITANIEFLLEAIVKMDTAVASLVKAKLAHEPSRECAPTVSSEPASGLPTLLQEVKGYLYSVRECCRHQSTITDSVLDLSRLEAGKVQLVAEPFCPVLAMEQSLEMIFARGREKRVSVGLDTAVQHNEYLIKGDSLRLRQIVLNLLSNSVKFTEPGKSVTLRLFRPELAGDRIQLRLTVIDQGTGMTPEELDGLFKRFGKTRSSVSKNYSGSGLGLSICAELVRLLDGTIEVKSQKDVGTEIHIAMKFGYVSDAERKIYLENAKLSSPQQLASNGTPLMNGCNEKFSLILCAEDNLLNQKVMAKYLQHLDYNFVMTNDGAEALERFRNRSLPPIDFVLLDIEMPNMDGREAAKAIRDYERITGSLQVPIVALSGNARKEQVNQALAVGFNDYLTKPCKRDVLLAMLQKWEHARSN